MPLTLTAKMIDPSSDRPKYLQVVDVIRVALDEKQLRPNESLPGEMDMATLLGVSRNTIRDALAELARDGLITTQMGKAAKVTPPVPVRVVKIGRYREDMNLIRAGVPADQAGSPFTRDHEIEWDDTDGTVQVTRELATANDARLLGLSPADMVVRRAFVRHVDGQPVKIQRSAVPAAIADGTPLADGPFPFHGGILRELTAAGVDLDAPGSKVVESVTPRMSFEAEQIALRMPRQGIVLVFERVIYAGGRAVEASRVIVTGPSHAVCYEIEL